MPKVKLGLDRTVPIIKDIKVQFQENPTCTDVFLYDDGQVFRAFAVEDISIGDDWVSGTRGGKRTVMIPRETPWRLVSTANFDLHSVADLEVAAMKDRFKKHKLQAELAKKLEPEPENEEAEAAPVEVPDPGKHFKVRTHV